MPIITTVKCARNEIIQCCALCNGSFSFVLFTHYSDTRQQLNSSTSRPRVVTSSLGHGSFAQLYLGLYHIAKCATIIIVPFAITIVAYVTNFVQIVPYRRLLPEYYSKRLKLSKIKL